MSDSRYPYTYACDYIRGLASRSGMSTKIDRCDASKIISGVALVVGLSHEDLAIKLADYYKAHERELEEASMKEFMQALEAFK
jgi:hypothetical protein